MFTIIIETERLELTVLNTRQLRLFAFDIETLERELSIVYQGETLSGHFFDVIKYKLSAAEKDPENYPWHSFWLIVRKADRVAVGSAAFKGLPNINGEAEIGYGLNEKFQHNGYMTEAVNAMCDWAEGQNSDTIIIVETDKDNIPSQNVLKRCGFSIYKHDNTLWWKRRSIIAPCGDNCIFCPRYNSNTEEELKKTAELWYRIGFRDRVPSAEDMRCGGCGSHKECTYGLIKCLKEHEAEKCCQCISFPCEKIDRMLSLSNEFEKKCKEVCSAEEYNILKKAFFSKEKYIFKL